MSCSPQGECETCSTPLQVGYGMAGGGIGPYFYCPNEDCYKPHFSKPVKEPDGQAPVE